MANPFLENIKNVKETARSLPEQVAEQIRQLIIERHMENGEKLPNEFELAGQLNVGRGTVREAVKLLVARNVLEIRRGHGTFIAGNTGLIDDPFGFAYMDDEPRLVQELYDIRLQLEPWVAGLAAQLCTEENLNEVRFWESEVVRLIGEGGDHLPADQQFHTAIARCTQNRVLPMLIPTITYSVYLFGKLSKRSLGTETVETHARIVEAVTSRDPEAARAAMTEHLLINKRAIAELAGIQEN